MRARPEVPRLERVGKRLERLPVRVLEHLVLLLPDLDQAAQLVGVGRRLAGMTQRDVERRAPDELLDRADEMERVERLPHEPGGTDCERT